MVLPQHDVIVQAIELIESRIGIAVGKQFSNEFADLFNRLAHNKPIAYLQQLKDLDEKSPEWQRLINTLTVGETYFLREDNHFDLLKKHILPKLVLLRRQQGNHRLRIWSAGSASGEEPYSIAIMLHQFLPDIATWNIEIYATDINEFALQTARHSVYRQWAFRHADALFQHNYFDQVDGGLQIKSFIRDMVTFRQHNLLHDNNLSSFDIIFCKNVLLYFDEPYVEQAENQLFDALNPDGWLFLGQAEALRFNRERWLTHIFPGSPIYQRPGDGVQPSALAYPPIDNNELDVPIPICDTYEEDYYRQAVGAIHQDEYALAEQYLSNALNHGNNIAESHTLLAWLFANRKAFPEAEAHLKATLAIEPLHANAHYVSALVALERGYIENAYRTFQMTLYCDKYHALAAFMLANLYAKSGHLTKAFSQWTKVQRAIEQFAPSDYVSDLSDLTAGQLDALISSHLSDI